MPDGSAGLVQYRPTHGSACRKVSGGSVATIALRGCKQVGRERRRFQDMLEIGFPEANGSGRPGPGSLLGALQSFGRAHRNNGEQKQKKSGYRRALSWIGYTHRCSIRLDQYKR